MVIYLVWDLYESFIHPFTILSGLPSRPGRIADAFAFGRELDVYAFVG